jgi:hypothetical protein
MEGKLSCLIPRNLLSQGYQSIAMQLPGVHCPLPIYRNSTSLNTGIRRVTRKESFSKSRSEAEFAWPIFAISLSGGMRREGGPSGEVA